MNKLKKYKKLKDVRLYFEYDHPDDIYYEILKFLNYKDLFPYCVVCKMWNSIIKSRLSFEIILKRKIKDESSMQSDEWLEGWFKYLPKQKSSDWIHSMVLDKQALLPNKVVELCDFLRLSTNLTSLSVSGCVFIDSKALEAIGSLSQLKYLNMNDCKLYKLESVSALCSLEGLTSLDIGRNIIKDTDIKMIGNSLQQLTFLGLSNSKIATEGVKSICALPNLIKLELDISAITFEGLNIISESMKTVEDLNISGVFKTLTLTGDGMDVCKLVCKMKQLKRLTMAGNKLGDEGIEAIIKSLPLLTHLNITGSRMNGSGLSNISSLQYLSSLEISTKSGIEPLQYITQLKYLKKLKVSYMEAEGLDYLCSSSFSNTLTHLAIPFNRLSDSDLEILCSFFTKLEYFDCSWSSVTDFGAKHISTLSQLTDLNLRKNNLTEDAIHYLSVLTKLTSLDISNNPIGNEGANFLCSSFERLTTLRIEACFCFQSSEALKNKRGLQTLDMDIFDRYSRVVEEVDPYYYRQPRSRLSCCSLM